MKQPIKELIEYLTEMINDCTQEDVIVIDERVIEWALDLKERM